MFKNKTITKALSFLLLLVMMIGYLPIGAIQAEASENITLNLESEPEIDIVLTKGVTNLNLTNFERDLKAKLANKGINTSKVNISAIETQEVVANESNAQQIFSDWQNFSVLDNDNQICCGPYDSPKWKHDDFYISGDRIVKSDNGNTRPASGFYDPAPNAFATEDAEYNFRWGIHPTQYGSFSHGEAGFLFRMQDEKNYYAYIMDNHSACGNIGLNGGEALVKVVNGNYQILAQTDDFPMYYAGQTENIKIVTKGNNIKVYRNGSLKLNVNDNTYKSGTHGFYVWDQYGAYFSNISYSTEVTKNFSEVIRQPSWRYGSKRFLVNVENNKVSDFDSPSASGEILTRLINEEIHYLAIGSNTNKSQAEGFIARNNNNGRFYSNSNYNTAIEGIADYIKNQMPTQEPTGEEHVLMGEPMKVSVNPSHLMKDTQTAEYPQGRWRIDHDYEFYDNNLGQAIWANQWQKDLILTFDKPGKYEIFFENVNPEPRFIYVHRRPVANFSLNVTKSGSNYNVSINDLSYDPDKEFSPDRGIAEHEWKWKETTATNWTNGRVPNTLPLGKNYIVQLRVKDHQGEWSIPEARYITTDNISTPPVANFNVSPNPLSMYVPLTVNDNSYDPAGKTITQREWIVTKNGTQVHKGSTPLTNFRPYGEGRYRISLRVKNSDNLWSEAYVREIEVTPDNTAPTSIVNPTRGGPTNENITVNIEFDDEGGSGFDSQRYAVTTSITPPTSGWSAWNTSKTRNIVLSQEGKLYIHIEAKDNAGNLHKRTVGEYHVDKTPPIITIGDYVKTPTNKDIVVTASTNEGTLNKTSHTFTENSSFTFVAIDEAGNRTEKTVTITNIDKVPPIITIKPYSTAWTNKDVVVSAEVDKGTLNKTSHTFTKNSSFEFVATDAAGNVTKKTVSVSNIDKTPPTSPIVKRVEHRLVISPGTDYESGIDKNIYSINGGEWVVLTEDIDLSDFPDGNHTIKVKAIDIATNETEVIFNFITEYEKIKEEVGDELDETIIDDEIDLDDLEDRLDELEEIIGDLPDGDDRDKLQDELDKLRERLQIEADKRLKEAIQAVELAEATRREPYIQRAKDKVAKLKEGPDKEALEDRIRAIEYVDTEAVLLEEATKAVELAEATRRNVHIQDAKEKVSKLKNGPDKTALENRIKAIEHVDQGSIDFKDAELAVKLAEATKREPYVSKAKAKVRLLTSGSEKEQLEQRLYEIEKMLNQNNEAVLKNAERIVSLAEKLKRESNLSSARDAINRLKPSEEKTSFLIRLEKVAKDIEGKELTDEDIAIIKATYYVELAETYDYEFMIRKAMEEVEKLPEGSEKQNLSNRLNNIAK